eukprot:gene32343-39931_t
MHAVSAAALIVIIIQLELIFERSQCMVTYMMFMVMYRIIENRTLFDNIAICVAYTSDIASINHRAQSWYSSSNLFVWAFLGISCLLAHMYKRICFRVWEHVRVLIILREKTKQEKALGNFVIAAHIPMDIQNHLFKPVGEGVQSTTSPPPSLKSPQTSSLAMSGGGLTSGTFGAAASSATSLSSVSSVLKARKVYSGKAFLKPVLTSAARHTGTNQQPNGASQNKIVFNPSSSNKVSPKFYDSSSAKTASPKRTSDADSSLKFSSKTARQRRNGSMSSMQSRKSNSSPSGSPTVAAGTPKGLSHYGQLQTNKRVDDDMLRSACKVGIVSNFSDAQLSTAQLDTICGLDKRNTVLIAIKSDYSATRRECVLNNLQEYDFLEVVDHLGAAHRVTRARVFGNTWVGCIGVFNSWDSDAANVYHGMVFACEVSLVAKQFAGRVSVAIDYGNVICGYLSNSLNFDFFGQEIRWLLMVVELREHGIVALGDSARSQLSAFKKHVSELTKQQHQAQNQSQNSAAVTSMSQFSMQSLQAMFPDLPSVRAVELDQRQLDMPWKMDSKITVNFIVNAVQIVDDESLQSRLTAYYNTAKTTESPKWSRSDKSTPDMSAMYVAPPV